MPASRMITARTTVISDATPRLTLGTLLITRSASRVARPGTRIEPSHCYRATRAYRPESEETPSPPQVSRRQLEANAVCGSHAAAASAGSGKTAAFAEPELIGDYRMFQASPD
jgi:hypothetical protein